MPKAPPISSDVTRSRSIGIPMTPATWSRITGTPCELQRRL